MKNTAILFFSYLAVGSALHSNYAATTCDQYTSSKDKCLTASENGVECAYCTSAAVGALCAPETDAKGLPSSVFKCQYQTALTTGFNATIPNQVTGTTAGVDISSLVETSDFQCLLGKGYSFMVMRGYRSSGTIDSNVCASLNNAKSAGIAVRDTYLFPCPTCSASPSEQIKTLVDHLTSNCKASWSGRMWLDIEGVEYWTGSTSSNKAFYQGLIDYCKSSGLRCGVYASQYQWQSIFGSTSYSYGTNYPLWYAHYDNVASFSDYSKYSFGGWTSPYAKQYAGTTSICGASVDFDYSPNF